jgi:hypothetical protein
MNDVVEISGYDLPLSDDTWAWAQDNAAGIKRFWNKAQAEKPALVQRRCFVDARAQA